MTTKQERGCRDGFFNIRMRVLSVRDGETLLLGADHDEVVTAVDVAAPCTVNKAEVTHRVDVKGEGSALPCRDELLLKVFQFLDRTGYAACRITDEPVYGFLPVT